MEEIRRKQEHTDLHLSTLPDIVQVVVDSHEVEQVGDEAQALLSGLQLGQIHGLQPSQAGQHLRVVVAPRQLPPTQLREDALAVVFHSHLCRQETFFFSQIFSVLGPIVWNDLPLPLCQKPSQTL